MASLEEPATEPSYPASPTTATELPVHSYEIPAVIDLAYVEGVLQALYDLEGEAGRLIVQEEEISSEAVNILAATYDPSQLDQRIRLYREQLAAGLEGTVRPPGNVEVTIDRVIHADTDCVYAAGLRDYSQVVESPRPRTNETDFFQLLPLNEQQDARDLNPTPWVIGGSVIRDDGSEPENPCAV